VGQQEREAETAAVEVLADLVRQLEQQTTQPRRHSFCERDAARVLKGETVFLADALHGAHLGLFMTSQKS
jgi:hypothetical protein